MATTETDGASRARGLPTDGGPDEDDTEQAQPKEAQPDEDDTEQAQPKEAQPDEDDTNDDESGSADAPPVVAVVVTRDPGPWLEESLSSLASQDYPNLVIVVIDAASEQAVAERVAAVVPTAFVRRLEADAGYASNANQALRIVEGAAYYLFCHDDAAAEPDALRMMVEEAFRSNAGLVCPKLVAWDAPSRILSVGMNADKIGALADRAIPGELDQEQHDAVRDVFVAPGGFVLVRADLFESLGGFDPEIPMFGDDLDLSWRAQVAGARVIVAPAARVRHIEVTRSGTLVREGIADQADIIAMGRRHELRTLLKCYSLLSLARVLPQAVALSMAEAAFCMLSGRWRRAKAIVSAWWWNASRLGEVRRCRRAVQAMRLLPDHELRELQSPGFARLSSFSRRAIASFEGVHHLSVHGVEPNDGDQEEESASPFAFASRFDMKAGSWTALWWLVVLAVLAVGMRHWATAGLPLVGQLGPLRSSMGLLHGYLDGSVADGTGSYSPAPAAWGTLGLAGTLLAGGTGFLQKLLFLGAIPAGAVGAYRLAVPMGGRGVRMLAAVGYLAVPLPYDLLSGGRLEALVAYATTPWFLRVLLDAAAIRPFRRGKRGGLRSTAGFGICLAMVSSVVPGELAVLGMTWLAVLVGCALSGGLLGGAVARWGRAGVRFAGAAVLAIVLLAPWIPAFAGRWASAAPLTGQGGDPALAPGLGSYVRFDLGFLGGGIAGWVLLLPGVLALVIGRGWRFRWAVRWWCLLVAAWLLAWSGAHGWLGGGGIDPELALVPGAVAVAALVAIGGASFVVDLPSHRFGWRQAASAAAAVGLALACLPPLAAAASGQFGLPSAGWSTLLASLGAPSNGPQGAAQKVSRGARPVLPMVLWLGDPRALPLGSWPLSAGVAYALSLGFSPGARYLWPPVSPGRVSAVAGDLLEARRGLTTRLGTQLSRAGVSAIVVPLRLAPGASSQPFPPPGWLTATLAAQPDLRLVPLDPSVVVYELPRKPDASAARSLSKAPTAPSYRYPEIAGQLALWTAVAWVAGGGAVVAAARRRVARRPGA
jgi:GT2 family glycosyltransferase